MRKLVCAVFVALCVCSTSLAQCPAAGSCLVEHATPGCDDPTCCNLVCSFDPFCCTDSWDLSCAVIAASSCDIGTPGECGDPLAGSCFQVHGTGACDDASCCTMVCQVDPTCCSQAWDSICVALANSLCTISCEVACPVGGQQEAETCGQNKNDPCFFPAAGSAAVFTICGKTVCGRVKDDSGQGGAFTDVDIYQVLLMDPDGDGLARLTLSFTSAFIGFAAITPASCGDLSTNTVAFVESSACVINSVSKCVPPGSYRIVVSPGSFPIIGNTVVACGSDNTYKFTVSCSQDCEQPCNPEAGSCLETHRNPGCNDEACCSAVCNADSFCCERAWDSFCVQEAYQTCVGPPANDDCTGATPLEDGVTLFNTYAATPSGVPTPRGCVALSGSIGADVWFTYSPTCDGDVTISTCDSADFNTVLAVYASCDPRSALACNDNRQDCGGATSSLTFAVSCGQNYLVRIGGVNDEIGAGSITVSCNGERCPSPCPADLDSSGVVDGADLGLLLANWSLTGQGDIDGSGTVDGGDLGLLLAAWGDCP